MPAPVNDLTGGAAQGDAAQPEGAGRSPVGDAPSPTIVLIDLDGTMVRHRNEHLLTVLEVFETLGSGAGRLRRRLPGRDRGDQVGPGGARQRPPRFLGRRLLNALRRRPIPDIVAPAPGIFELLDVLRSRRIAVAVASNCLGYGYGELVLDQCGFTEYVSCAVFRENVARSKPDPDSLHLALERLGQVTVADTIWCIGDRAKDMIAADRLRRLTPARVVPVAYGPDAGRAVRAVGSRQAVISCSHHEIRHVLERALSRRPASGSHLSEN